MSDPSPERISAARARGEVAVSQRLTVAASIACALAVTGAVARLAREGFERGLRVALSATATGDALPPPHALRDTLTAALAASAPALAATTLGVALAHALQTRFLVVWPDGEPSAPRVAFREAGAATLWALALSSVAIASGSSLARDASLAPHGAVSLGRSLSTVLSGVAWRVTAAAIALGAVELAVRRARHFEALRLTRGEAEREAREREGDPRIKAARARRMRA